MALEAAGYRVFFDRDSLPAGESFDVRILEALAQSDLLIFLLSPTSIKAGAYSLTELGFARRQWANPAGRVLPVVIRAVDVHALPVYLRSVTLLEPSGDVAAEVVAAVYELRRRGWRRAKWVMGTLAVLTSAVVIGYYTSQMRAYDCRFVATNARAFATRMIDYANTATQREHAILEEGVSLDRERSRNSSMLMLESDLSRRYSEERNQSAHYAHKQFELDRRLLSVVQEHNSRMSQLAKESTQYSTAIFAHCLHGGDVAPPESDLSFDTGEAYLGNLRYSSPDKRFKVFLKLAAQLEALAARAARAGGESSKKSDTTTLLRLADEVIHSPGEPG